MGECSVYSSLQADSKVKFAASPTSWPHLALTDFSPEELSHMAGAVDDITINIVVLIKRPFLCFLIWVAGNEAAGDFGTWKNLKPE